MNITSNIITNSLFDRTKKNNKLMDCRKYRYYSSEEISIARLLVNLKILINKDDFSGMIEQPETRDIKILPANKISSGNTAPPVNFKITRSIDKAITHIFINKANISSILSSIDSTFHTSLTTTGIKVAVEIETDTNEIIWGHFFPSRPFNMLQLPIQRNNLQTGLIYTESENTYISSNLQKINYNNVPVFQSILHYDISIPQIGLQTLNSSLLQFYIGTYRIFLRFCIAYELPFSMTVSTIRLFIAYLWVAGYNTNFLRQTLSTIRIIFCYYEPIIFIKDLIVEEIIEAAKNYIHYKATRNPISIEELFNLRKYFLQMLSKDISIVYITLMLIAYFGLFKISELVTTAGFKNRTIQYSDVTITNNKALIIVNSLKEDNITETKHVVQILHTTCSLCPLCSLINYHKQHKIKNGPYFILPNGNAVSYFNWHQILRSIAIASGLSSSFNFTHSFRKGRAHALYRGGYTLKQIQKAGRLSSNIVNNYIYF